MIYEDIIEHNKLGMKAKMEPMIEFYKNEEVIDHSKYDSFTKEKILKERNEQWLEKIRQAHENPEIQSIFFYCRIFASHRAS